MKVVEEEQKNKEIWDRENQEQSGRCKSNHISNIGYGWSHSPIERQIIRLD